MGIFGSGLYAGDFALDMRSVLGAVLRLPFDPDRLVEILSERETAAAHNSDNEDHATFWLVIADQFAKRGIACERIRTKALGIIDTGADIAMLEKLGMKPAELRKRQRMLDELRSRIASAPLISKPRAVLKVPQPLLMEIGDVLVYPTCDGENINPYFRSKADNIHYTRHGREPWKQDGWAAMVILDCGRVFDFLAWYRPVMLAEARSEKPALNSLSGPMLWRVESPGTCSANHFRKMQLEKVGVLPVDTQKANEVYPQRFGTGLSAAVQDISIANRMKVALAGKAMANPGGEKKGSAPTLSRIEDVLRENPDDLQCVNLA